MSGHPIAPQAQRPQQQFQVSHMMHSYSNSPLARSTADLSEVTHEYEPDVDADGFRHPGNHHAVLPGDYSPGSSLQVQAQAKHGRPSSSHGRSHMGRPGLGVLGEEPKRDSFTFEHEPDVDADGERHHHEILSNATLRELQDVVVPLDPRAGRIVITPAPSLKPNFSPYRHIDALPNRSIEDFQDPEELHSHATMIYGIDEARASQFSVPDWQEGEAAAFIEEASHGELNPPTVSARHVATKLPIEPTGEVMAPLGNIAGDTRPVGPTRNMSESEAPGIDGAYTVDGEGSAGLPFDGNAGQGKKEGDIEISDEPSIAPPNMSASIETIRPGQKPAIASLLAEPEKKPTAIPGAVEDVKLPGKEGSLSQDGSAMDVDGVKDDRPEWLRAAELMANNDYEKLAEQHLIVPERSSQASIDYASAGRATLGRDSKIDRGTSYPSLNETDEASQSRGQDDDVHEASGDRQGVSHLPEKDLGGANPPTGSSERQDKFAVEDETVNFKSRSDVEPATAAKFLGLSAGAAAGATLPAAALMTNSRDAKSHTSGETKMTEEAPKVVHNDPQTADARAAPAVPKSRPTPKASSTEHKEPETAQPSHPAVPQRPRKPSSDEIKHTPSIPARPTKERTLSAEKSVPSVPRRPASSTSQKESPQVPSRPTKTMSMPKDVGSKPEPAAKPNVPARPVPGKLAGSSKFAFASTLEAKLKAGPAPTKKKEVEAEEEEEKEKSAEPAKPLADARKGRAKGPQKRKPPTAASIPEESTPTGLSSALHSPVVERGETFISRFGVEMRSMSVQTGVIRITSPAGRMTIMENAGTDYVGQTVVVDSPTSKPQAIPESEQESEIEPISSTVEESKEDVSGISGQTEEEEPASHSKDDESSDLTSEAVDHKTDLEELTVYK